MKVKRHEQVLSRSKEVMCPESEGTMSQEANVVPEAQQGVKSWGALIQSSSVMQSRYPSRYSYHKLRRQRPVMRWIPQSARTYC